MELFCNGTLRTCLKSVIARSVHFVHQRLRLMGAKAERRSNLLSRAKYEIASVALLPRNDNNKLFRHSLNHQEKDYDFTRASINSFTA